MLRALSFEELALVSGGLEVADGFDDTDGGFADGDDYGGGGGSGGDGSLPGVIDAGGYDLPPGATNDTPDPSQVLNTPISSGSTPPSIAPSNPTLKGPWIPIGGGYSIQPGVYSPTNPGQGGGIGIRKSF